MAENSHAKAMIPNISLKHSSLDDWRQACETFGFFYLTDHAIDSRLLHESMALSRVFFEQPATRKRQISRTDTNCWGYYDAELTKNQRDWKEILDIGPAIDTGPLAGAKPQLPDLEGFAATLATLTHALHETALAVTSKVLMSMHASIDLAPVFDDHSSFLRINYYPTCPAPAAADTPTGTEANFGIHHHTDAGAITLLCQEDVTSLQMWRESAWHTIPSRGDALIVNLGDIVQVWSNDAYRAPLHRVLAQRDHTRISIPYFLNPSYDYSYQPLVGDTPNYRPISWGEFRAGRSAGDYADHGAEIQITDYRIP